jgi:ribose 5-phosphate isomerase A
MPAGIDLPPFAVNRNRMLESEARQEQLYRMENMQPVELPQARPAPQASLAQILMNQYDPATAPEASFMLRSLSAASPRGRARRVDKRAEDAAFAVERVGQLLKSGQLKDIIAIPTSVRTKEQCEALGIPLTTLGTPESRFSKLDVAIDGADAVDPALNLVKGGGGALFREKIVEECAEKFIVIVDESKLCDGLGPGFPLPVEIVPFCYEHTMNAIAALPSLKGCEAKLRLGNVATGSKVDGDKPAITDNGNYIVDLFFNTPIKDPPKAAAELKATCGVVEHGLFCGMSTAVIIAGKSGISVKNA